MSKKEELLPCAHCGGPAEFLPYKPQYIWSLRCQKCGIGLQFIGPDEEDSAVAKWNRREHVPPVPELKGCFPVVLYLKTQQEADELIEAVREVKPGMEMRNL